MRTPSAIITLVAGLAACLAHSQKRPNIMVILADDMGYSDLSLYGGEAS